MANLQQPGLEAIWLELRTANSPQRPLIVCATYRPPGGTLADIQAYSDGLEDCLLSLNLPVSTLLLTGDFNAHNSSWLAGDRTTPVGQCLETAFRCFGLEQLVNFPTHWSPSGRSSCLDLIVTNSPQQFLSVDSAAPLGSSDHVQLICRVRLPVTYKNQTLQHHFLPTSTPTPPGYNFKLVPRCVWDDLNAELADVHWKCHLRSSHVDDALSSFHSILSRAMEKHLGYFSRRPLSPSCRRLGQPPWVDAPLRAAIKAKHDFYSVCKKYPTQLNMHVYRSQRNLVKSLTRSKYRGYIRSVQATLQDKNRPSLLQFVSKLKNHKVSRDIPTLTISSTQQATTSSAKATALNSQFASVAVPDDPSLPIPPIAEESGEADRLTSAFTTTAAIRRYIRKLPSDKAPGPDGITNLVLKSLAPSIAYPLCLIFNLSFRTGRFPSAWKTANVIPIYKKGSRHEASNYRPISPLSCVSKLCEHVFYDQLYCHVSSRLSSAQSGFRRGDSTTLQLTRLVQLVCRHRDAGDLVGICFFRSCQGLRYRLARGALGQASWIIYCRRQSPAMADILPNWANAVRHGTWDVLSRHNSTIRSSPGFHPRPPSFYLIRQ